MARLKLVLAFFALMILTAGVACAAYYYQKFVKPQQEVEIKISGKVKEERPDLGKKHYVRALGYIDEGELISARNELQYMLDIYPESPTIPEAKRVLGEINLDLIISKIPIEGKVEYKVKRGDALSTIARKNKTTIDYIMRANSKTTTLIYPNEDLTVFNLACSAEIDLDNSTLTIRDGERFIKEYNILEVNLPGQFPNSVSTTISSKVAYLDGKTLKFTDSHYLDAMKWIRTGRTGLFIRQVLPDGQIEEGKPKPYGVMVDKADMEEIFTVLRHGSTIKVLPKAKKKR